jgi:nucleotide-binding universal stress UspA family protein
LYATDLSETARHAARYACSLGHRYAAPVTVLHVVPDVVETLSRDAGIDLAKQVESARRQELNRANVAAATTTLAGRVQQVSEQVAREIVEAVREGGYDLVVMGTHGHGALESAFVGSVAEGVLRNSRVPVLVARIPRSDEAAPSPPDAAEPHSAADRPQRT